MHWACPKCGYLLISESALSILSPRERAVLLALLDGQRVRDISNGMGINKRTVSTYKVRALQKLGLKSVLNLFVSCKV